MPKCTGDKIGFRKMGRRLIEADFSGGDPSSDGGLMLLRQIDERIGLTQSAAAALSDPRGLCTRCATCWRNASTGAALATPSSRFERLTN